jgi:PKD repeat protein
MASPISGTFPLTVDFEIDASGGEAPYSYAWNFGVSGATATSATTSYTYTTAGTFDVSVVVSDAAYEHVTQTTQVVVSTPVPLAAHAQATARGVAPLKVELTGSASGGTGPYAYAWTIGSVLAGSTAAANYTITTPGTYTVVLAVTDANGTTALASALVLVLAPLTAAFAWTVGTPYCSQGTGVANVTLNATASGGYGGPVYNWSFPNGAGSGANTTVILPAGATSTLVLSVSDSDHNTAHATHSVSVASVSCSTPSGSISAPVDLLLLLLIVLVAVVVAVEAVLLLRRKKK